MLLQRWLVGCVTCALFAAAAGSCTALGCDDGTPLVQRSLSKEPWLDVYITPAETLEDFMYWAVLFKSMKPLYHAHPHWLLIRNGSELFDHAHAIRMAIADAGWHAKVDIAKPQQGQQLNLATMSDTTAWKQLAILQYSPDEYRRLVQMSADMLVYENIDSMTHRPQPMILAREQGDCRNLTEAVTSEKPAMSLLSMVPDAQVTTWLTSSSNTRLFSEDTPSSRRAIMLSTAFSTVHPGREQTRFGATEVLSASCLINHDQQALMWKEMADSMKALYLGDEGRQLINGVIIDGPFQLAGTLGRLEDEGRWSLLKAVRTWFGSFASSDVQSILEAAKLGAVETLPNGHVPGEKPFKELEQALRRWMGRS